MSRVAFLSHCVSSLCPDSDGPLKAYHSPLYPPSFEPAPTLGGRHQALAHLVVSHDGQQAAGNGSPTAANRSSQIHHQYLWPSVFAANVGRSSRPHSAISYRSNRSRQIDTWSSSAQTPPG